MLPAIPHFRFPHHRPYPAVEMGGGPTNVSVRDDAKQQAVATAASNNNQIYGYALARCS
jgi:hypothetical protein